MSLVWKKHLKQAAGCVMAAILSLSACLSNAPITAYADNYGKGGTVREMTSQQIVEDMGLGYNIGNTFDSIGSFITTNDPTEYQKAWGNDPVTKLFIQKVRQSGFKSIRLPVSWSHWIGADDHVAPAYLAEVQKVVDWCMEEDMYVILNIHHDGGESDVAWIRKASTDYAGTSKRYQTVWKDIADHFADYGDHLIFESMNEVAFPDVSMSRQFETMNSLNQLFVDTVRSSGGNNPKRHLLIAGLNTNIDNTCDKRYKMPDDPAGRCMLSIHYYSPPAFAVAEHDVDWCTPVTQWGSEEDLAAVRSDLDKLAEHFVTKGVPVIIGEYGVLTEDNKEVSSVRAYVQKIPEIILEYGMCPVLWDTSNAGDMKFIERNTGEFYDPVIKANYQALSQKIALGQIQKIQFDFPTYKEVDVPISPDGWVSLDAFQPDRILGIKFQVTCANDWDSYGGGGIYIDSWDNTINWQFNSVYDDIIHMFTPEEKARIQDQLGVMIWWTDESKGGSHRDALSIADGKVTLLYAEQTGVTPSGMVRTTSSGGSGGGGGGGGGGGRGGSAPNYSTDPVGSEQGLGGKYRYIIKVDGNKATNDENVQQLDLRQLQPDYQIGDTVKITLTCVSNGGTSYAIGTMEGGEFKLSETANNEKTYSWTCTPDYGNASVSVWYLGGDYMAFNADVEVVKKAPRFDPITITYAQAKDGYDLTPQIKAAMERYGLKAGDRMKITVSTEQVDGAYTGDITFTNENDMEVNAGLGENATIMTAPSAGSGFLLNLGRFNDGQGPQSNPVRITDIRVEALDGQKEPDVLVQMESSGRVEIPTGKVIRQTATDGKYGLKLYVDCTEGLASLSANLVVNNDWSYGQEVWETGQDADGSYIWYPLGENDTVNSVLFAGWYWPGTLKIKKVVHMAAQEKPPFDSFIIEHDEGQESAGGYDLTEKIKEAKAASGINDGSRVKVIIHTGAVVRSTPYEGTIEFTNADGFRIEKDLADVIVLAAPSRNGKILLKLKDDVDSPIMITDIQVERLITDPDALVQLESGDRVTITSKQIVQEQGSTEYGIKIYIKNMSDLDQAGYVNVNGWTNLNTLTPQNDSDGDYFWCPLNEADDTPTFEFGQWSGKVIYVDKVVHVRKTPITSLADIDALSSNNQSKDIPLNLVDIVEGEEAGVKVYLSSDTGAGAVIVINDDWDGAVQTLQEENGQKFLWKPFNEEVEKITIVRWWGDAGGSIEKVEIVTPNAPMPLSEEEELDLPEEGLQPEPIGDKVLDIAEDLVQDLPDKVTDIVMDGGQKTEDGAKGAPTEDPAEDPDDGKTPADDGKDKKDPADDAEDKKDPADDGTDENDPSKDESQNDKKDPADDSEGKADAPDDEAGKKDPSKDQEKDPNAAMDTSGESKPEEAPKADIPVKAVKDQEDVADAPAADPAQQSDDTK